MFSPAIPAAGAEAPGFRELLLVLLVCWCCWSAAAAAADAASSRPEGIGIIIAPGAEAPGFGEPNVRIELIGAHGIEAPGSGEPLGIISGTAGRWTRPSFHSIARKAAVVLVSSTFSPIARNVLTESGPRLREFGCNDTKCGPNIKKVHKVSKHAASLVCLCESCHSEV